MSPWWAILLVGFRATLNFAEFKVSLNPTNRVAHHGLTGPWLQEEHVLPFKQAAFMKFVWTILFQYNGNNLRVFINVYIWVTQLLSLEEKLLQENIRNFWFFSRALTSILF